MYRKCCIPGCNSNSDRYGCTLHKMPAAKEKVMLWHRAISAVPFHIFEGLTWDEIGKLYVCHKHFEAKFNSSKMRLRPNARPTLFTLEEIATGTPSNSTADTGAMKCECMGVSEHSYTRKRHYDHTYTMSGSTYHDAGPTNIKKDSELQDDNKKDNKEDSNIQEADNLTELAIFDNYDLPHSPESEFTTETVSDITENIINEDSTEKQVFSWQKTELIEADESDDVTPAVVPEQPRTYEVLTLSLFCDGPEPRPLSPEPCELVAVVPEDVESRCKDCASVIVGFSFWCVQCRRGAMCCACASRAPHDAHYVLRAPRGAAENRTLDILTVIRQQLLNENLLSLYEINEDGIKVEVKQEDEECPSPPPEPAATPDPLAVESHPELDNVDLHSDPFVVESHPDLLYVEPDADLLGVESHSDNVFAECLDEENIEHDHPFKRPRLMEHSQTLKPNTATTNDVQKLKVPTNIVEGRPTVQTLPCNRRMSQDVVLATTGESSGSQVALNIITSDPCGPQTVIEVTPSELKELQRLLLATIMDPGISKDILNAITSDLKAVSTILQAIPSDQIEIIQTDQHVKPNYFDGSETVQQVDLSQLSGSDVVVQVDPSDRTGSQTVLHIGPSKLSGSEFVLQVDANDPIGSQTVLHVDPSNLNELLTTLQNKTSEQLGLQTSDEQDVLLVSYSDPKRAQTVMQIDPGDRKRLQNVLKATDSDPKGSESAHIDPSDIRQSPHVLPTRTGSRTLLQAPSSRTGSQFLQKTVSSDRKGSQTLTKTTRSIGSRVLQKVSPGDSTASQSLPKVTASNRTESELVMMRMREMFQGTDFSGSKTYKKIQPKILKKTQSVLMPEKVQGIPKGAAIIKCIDNEPKTRFKVPQNVTRGISVPLKVTSRAKSTETVISNLDDVNMEAVEFLQQVILDSDSEETGLDKDGHIKYEDSFTERERVVNEHFSKKRKVDNRMDKATSDKVRESELENDGNQEDIEDTRTDTDSVTDVGSEVDDSDLDKDYAVEEDKLEESTDDTDVESISERSVGRRTRNATKMPVETSSQAMVRMLTSKAVVQVKPLTSLEIRKWMPNRKRPRKD